MSVHDQAGLLAEIARRACGLQSPPLALSKRAAGNDLLPAWKRWLHLGGGGNRSFLMRRMRCEGLRPSSLHQPARIDVLPAWCETLASIIAEARRNEPAGTDGIPGRVPDAAPLSSLLAPFRRTACRRLDMLCGPLYDNVDDVIRPSAVECLADCLMTRLSELAGPCVIQLFREAQSAGDGGASPIPVAAIFLASAAAPTAQYKAFVAAQHASGYEALFLRWPVLARLMATLVEQWVDASAEFISRLRADHPQLQACFFKHASPPGPVVAIESTLSDPHAGGRMVMKLLFERGGELVYKPRPVDMEAGFQHLLAWFNSHAMACAESAGFPSHRLALVLPRGPYGWMECVPPRPMQTGMEKAYHWRLGGLMGLYRALNGTDMHLENVIASGEFPVLVDAECLLHPSDELFPETRATGVRPHEFRADALLGMGALALYGFGSDGKPYSYGLIGNGRAQSGPDQRKFLHPDTDWMCLMDCPAAVPAHHLAHTAQGAVNSLLHTEEIVQGYRTALRMALLRCDELLRPGPGPLEAFRRARGRHLVRPTSHYGVLMREATRPPALESGVLFELSFEPLYRHLADARAAFRAMAPVERTALHVLDVPRFMFDCDSRQLLDADARPLGEFYASTPFERFASTLKQLTQQQIEWECEILGRASSTSPPEETLRLQTFVRQRLGQAGGGSTWLGMVSGTDGIRFQPVGSGLYGGCAGLELALAAAAAASEPGLRVLARDSMRSFVRMLDEGMEASFAQPLPKSLFSVLGLGMDKGMAGILFTLQASSSLIDDPELRHATTVLAHRMACDPELPAMIAADKRVDLLGGAAGLLLMLLSWHAQAAAAEKDAYLLAAIQCGKHLRHKARCATGAGGVALSWPVHSAVGLSGLSHGGSGFALALAALHAATGDHPWLEDAVAALRHESTLFDSGRGNWRDLRRFRGGDPAAVQAFGNSWCHGAPGIALARAALLKLIGNALDAVSLERLRQDLEIGLLAVQRALAADNGHRLDDLCCGSAGHIDILLECGRLMSRPDLVATARQEAGRRLQAWSDGEGDGDGGSGPRYWFTGHGMAGMDPGLFKGIAGWHYLAARIARPDKVPCVLLPMIALPARFPLSA